MGSSNMCLHDIGCARVSVQMGPDICVYVICV